MGGEGSVSSQWAGGERENNTEGRNNVKEVCVGGGESGKNDTGSI